MSVSVLVKVYVGLPSVLAVDPSTVQRISRPFDCVAA
jgi:hypothetical protein